MGIVSDMLSLVASLTVLALVLSGVMKLFQIGTDVRAMKDAVQDIRRDLRDAAPRPVAPGVPGIGPNMLTAGVPTAEELVRAVHAQTFGDDFPL
jgi:hypothetical protein